jgi:signal transduction histidine kinase
MKFLKRNLVASIIPALLLAAAGIYAIVQEAERSREAEESFLETKAESAAESISAKVRAIGESLVAEIAETPSSAREKILGELAETHPLVRSAYLWRPKNDSEKSGILWASERFPRDMFFGNERKRREEFFPEERKNGMADSSKPLLPSRKYNWASQLDRHGRRIACWRCIETNLVCLVELETMAVLSRIPVWLAESGMDAPEASGGNGLAAEVCDVTQGVLCPSSVKIGESCFGEASFKGMLMPEWSVRIGWAKGEEVVTGRVFRVVVGAGALLVLCAGWFVVGFVSVMKSALHAHRESMEKTTFVDNVSHELKTPLTSIMLYTDMLREGKIKDSSSTGKALEAISSECSRLLRMVESLLDFTRLEKKRRKFKEEKIEIVRFVKDTVDMVRDRFRDNGLEFFAPGEAFAVAESDAVRQILLNVLDNAAKYAAPYGTVDVAVRADEGKVEISVRDRGPGIGRASMKRVFERFWREDDSLTSEIPGNGLGLSIALYLAKGMGGDLRAYPGEDCGCVFVLELKGAGHGENSCSGRQ